jgi:glycosyltransferase involved in cell wall biosynthesis
MRLLLVGAFSYPHDQGSQIYFQEQAIALRAAGADVQLLTYARPLGAAHPADPWAERALVGFEHRTPPAWTSPRSLRSGPNWGKPLADLALVMTLRDAVASSYGAKPYDAILTHHAEAAVAALVALVGQSSRRPAIVYCAHTLLGRELSAYSKSSKINHFIAVKKSHTGTPRRSGEILDAIAHRIDWGIAKRVDGWIALTRESERVIRSASRTPGRLIPPPIPDPLARSERLEPARVARRFGLEPGGFFLYSGNRDGYQELDILRAVAATRGRPAPSESGLSRGTDIPLVIASHPRSGRAAKSHRRSRRDESIPGVENLWVDSPDEMLALIAAARATLVLRRSEGGFPIKLANSLAVGTPPIAFLESEWGLTHGLDSLICRPEQPVESLAEAIDRLTADADEVARLSTGARALYEKRHRPEQVAGETGRLLEEIVARRRG